MADNTRKERPLSPEQRRVLMYLVLGDKCLKPSCWHYEVSPRPADGVVFASRRTAVALWKKGVIASANGQTQRQGPLSGGTWWITVAGKAAMTDAGA
ncbi:MAG: hypothetical protein ABTQ30_15120 [Rhizobiaceae bacterium]